MKAIDNQLMLEFKIKPIKSKLSAMPLVGIALLFLGFCSCSPMRRAFYVRKQDASYEVSPCYCYPANFGGCSLFLLWILWLAAAGVKDAGAPDFFTIPALKRRETSLASDWHLSLMQQLQ